MGSQRVGHDQATITFTFRPSPCEVLQKKTCTLEPSLDSALSRSFISSRGLQGKNEHIAHGNSENRALNYWHAVSIVLIHYSMYFSKTFMVNNITTLCTYCLLPSLSIPKEAFFLFFFFCASSPFFWTSWEDDYHFVFSVLLIEHTAQDIFGYMRQWITWLLKIRKTLSVAFLVGIPHKGHILYSIKPSSYWWDFI